MPDISKCTDEKCPSKQECYRWNSKPYEYGQSYGDFKHDKKTGKCTSFWKRKGTGL
ncbi:MAG: hypothetical protein PHH82_04655 [Candidatus ainarchaeum sp.]|jgi:hypothetical protein|nr:hypothetical protein [Candidatus ainarchaeum sp.]